MNEMKIFDNEEFGQVRTVTIGGEPWFVGKDVAVALGYSNHRDALCKHVDREDKGESRIATPSGEQAMTIINESGLYALIFGSKLESAKRFKHWVTSEVLPMIRKTGGYLSEAEAARMQSFIESQLQFMEQQERFNQMIVDKLENSNCTQERQDENTVSASIEEESESQRRGRILNQLVDEMAKACSWDKSYALHRMYKTLEKVLNISLDEYLEIYQAETGNVHASTWKVVTEYNRLYKIAVILCKNTINSMKCQ